MSDDKIGDKVDFFDERNKKFVGIIESIKERIINTKKGKVKKNVYGIRVSRKIGISQLYLSVPKTTNDEIKPRWVSKKSPKQTKKQVEEPITT